MKLTPKYSYEFNYILNPKFTEDEQIKNFASLISDKDRFLSILSNIANNEVLIEKKLGFKLPEKVEFYIVRGELFKSFSEPVTIEYSILPEEMLAFLLKEIIKITIDIRFPDDITREKYVNSFLDYIFINGNWDTVDLVKFGKNLHDESLRLYEEYKMEDINFSKKTMKKYLEEMYK